MIGRGAILYVTTKMGEGGGYNRSPIMFRFEYEQSAEIAANF